MNTSHLSNLVAKLPEVYQPIFGHEELSRNASRKSDDRLQEIIQIQSAMRKKLGRPLSILDLGCAQGFFSISLAALGNNVVGIDYLDANTAVCKLLAEENSHFAVRFESANIEIFLQSILANQYDMILGLSVFHHLIHENGVEKVTKWLEEAARKVGCAIFELALGSEPTYWAETQPSNPATILQGFAFVHRMSSYSTHLSNIKRPFYFASNHYWYLDGHFEQFQNWTYSSHHLVQNNFLKTRKYFLGKQHIAKLFALDAGESLKEINQREVTQEAKILGSSIRGLTLPNLVTYGENISEIWLVHDLLEGELLSELIRKKQAFNARKIISDLLDQLCALEESHLFQNDLRAWNILVTPQGKATIIDYGNVSNLKKDVAWPYNIFLSFWIFIHEITSGTLATPLPLRPPLLSPLGLDGPYKLWAETIWRHSPSQWSFELFRREFHTLENKTTSSFEELHTTTELNGITTLMKAMQEYVNILNTHTNHKHDHLLTKANELLNENRRLQNELMLIYHSRSYRATAPLRSITQRIRTLFVQVNNLKTEARSILIQAANKFIFKVKARIKNTELGFRLLALIHQFFPVFWNSLLTKTKALIEIENSNTMARPLPEDNVLSQQQISLIDRFRTNESGQVNNLSAADQTGSIQHANILVDVTMTSIKDIKTGIQRVVKNLSKYFLSRKDHGRFKLIHIQDTKPRNALRFIEEMHYLPKHILGAERIIHIPKGSVLLLLDAGWEKSIFKRYLPIIKQIRKKQGKVMTMVYDLLPIRTPENFTPQLRLAFMEWVNLAVEYSDVLVCISQVVANDIKEYIENSSVSLKRNLEINYIHLGCDIEENPVSVEIREEVNNFLMQSNVNLFVMVGTLEPRKGHSFVMDVFEELWKSDCNFALCFAGKFGWNMEKVEKRIRTHREIQKRFLFIEDPTDSEINMLYSKATAVICASTSEGFGLPIIEAARHGVPGIVSDIPVFHEVGGEGVNYFSLGSVKELIHAIEQISILNPKDRLLMAQKVKPLSWKESGDWMLEVIDERKPYVVLEMEKFNGRRNNNA